MEESMHRLNWEDEGLFLGKIKKSRGINAGSSRGAGWTGSSVLVASSLSVVPQLPSPAVTLLESQSYQMLNVSPKCETVKRAGGTILLLSNIAAPDFQGGRSSSIQVRYIRRTTHFLRRLGHLMREGEGIAVLFPHPVTQELGRSFSSTEIWLHLKELEDTFSITQSRQLYKTIKPYNTKQGEFSTWLDRWS